jgi:hypothetical protein
LLNRRDAIGASLAAVSAAAATSTTATAAGANTAATAPADVPREAKGFGFTPLADANPLEAKITVFTTLYRTGLAMLTMRVNELAKCRAICEAAGMVPVGEGALPLPGVANREGLYLRGAVGELIEVVSA